MPMTNRADLGPEWDVVNPDHEKDDLRERDTQDLIEWLAIQRAKGLTWAGLIERLGVVMRGETDWAGEVAVFADEHGWPDTLRVIAQQMQAESSAPRA